jgi:hypothetical protein
MTGLREVGGTLGGLARTGIAVPIFHAGPADADAGPLPHPRAAPSPCRLPPPETVNIPVDASCSLSDKPAKCPPPIRLACLDDHPRQSPRHPRPLPAPGTLLDNPQPAPSQAAASVRPVAPVVCNNPRNECFTAPTPPKPYFFISLLLYFRVHGGLRGSLNLVSVQSLLLYLWLTVFTGLRLSLFTVQEWGMLYSVHRISLLLYLRSSLFTLTRFTMFLHLQLSNSEASELPTCISLLLYLRSSLFTLTHIAIFLHLQFW